MLKTSMTLVNLAEQSNTVPALDIWLSLDCESCAAVHWLELAAAESPTKDEQQKIASPCFLCFHFGASFELTILRSKSSASDTAEWHLGKKFLTSAE